LQVLIENDHILGLEMTGKNKPAERSSDASG
jgi:hypothetical protein